MLLNPEGTLGLSASQVVPQTWWQAAAREFKNSHFQNSFSKGFTDGCNGADSLSVVSGSIKLVNYKKSWKSNFQIHLSNQSWNKCCRCQTDKHKNVNHWRSPAMPSSRLAKTDAGVGASWPSEDLKTPQQVGSGWGMRGHPCMRARISCLAWADDRGEEGAVLPPSVTVVPVWGAGCVCVHLGRPRVHIKCISSTPLGLMYRRLFYEYLKLRVK